MQPCIMKCANAMQMYLAVINKMYSTSQPSIMKWTQAVQIYLAVNNKMYLTSFIKGYK